MNIMSVYIIGHNHPSIDIDSVMSSVLAKDLINKIYCKDAVAADLGKNIGKGIIKLMKYLQVPMLRKVNVKKEDVFVLVDHNDLHQSLARCGLNNKIIGIIDHHVDSGTKVEKFKTIQRVGSTATIIYNLYQKNNINITLQKARWFLYTIIAETMNLKLDSTTETDRKVVYEIYKKYKIKESREEVIQKIFELQGQSKKPIKKMFEEDIKEFDIFGKKVFVSAMKVVRKLSDFDINEIKKLLEHYNKDYDLCCVMILDICSEKTKFLYSGRLARYFKNQKHNRLLSRKRYLLPMLEAKIKIL